MSQPNRGSRGQAASRRDFLARSAAWVGGAAAGGLGIARAAHGAGSDLVKLGLVGCGGRGCGAVVSALSVEPGVKLTAMADPFDDRLQNARRQLETRAGGRARVADDHCFTGFACCQQLAESGVDVAILTEPPHFRPLHIDTCIDAGIHVFAEKPMAVDAPGVRRVLAAGDKARQKKLSLVSGFETRYSPQAREAVRRVHDGQIGQIVAIQTTYNTGFLWHRGRRPEWTEMEFQLRNWYYFTWLSGDHIVEQHVHYNDFVGWIMHEQPPAHAWGYGGRSVRVDPRFGDIFDHHAVVYQYPKGTRFYAFTRQQQNCFRENSKFVFGTKGHMQSERSYGYRLCHLDGQPFWTAEKPQRHPELHCFEEMFAAMRAGNPINDSFSMARSTLLAILGRMATHSGQRITWDDAFASNRVLAPKRYAWDADPPVLPGPDGHYPHAVPGVTEVL